MKTALVTGSNGFVGRHLIPDLIKARYDVVGTEDLRTFLFGGFSDGTVTWPAENLQFDVVVHLAANIVNVDQRTRIGMRAFDDIDLDLMMCRYIEAHPPRQAFIAMSSCAVDYPDDPYCTIKRTLEAYTKTLAKQGVKVAVLRPFSGYGPDQSEEYPFRAIFERALRREDPLTIWSDVTRDWIHIDDLVRAIMMGIDGYFPWGVPMEIGTGIGTRFNQLAEMIAHAVGYDPDSIEVINGKIGSSSYRVANPMSAAAYGFQARVSIGEGVSRAAEHFSQRQAQIG